MQMFININELKTKDKNLFMFNEIFTRIEGLFKMLKSFMHFSSVRFSSKFMT